MKLQGVDIVKEIANLMVICILKSNNNFYKNEIIFFCHFSTFLMPPCCPVFQQNQYGLFFFVKGHSRNISTKLSCNRSSRLWRKRIFKIWVFFSCSDAAATNTECNSQQSTQSGIL